MNLKFPAWLFFSLYYSLEPQGKWNEQKDIVAREVLRGLERHLKMYCLENDTIIKPNNFDNAKGYYADINKK